jgi:hypothetical protein
MSSAVEEHVCQRLADTPTTEQPFPHVYVENVFPAHWYAELIERLPAQERYQRLDEAGTVTKGAYPERFVCPLAIARTPLGQPGGEFWSDLSRWITGESFVHGVLSRFRDAVAARFGEDAELSLDTDCRFVRDFSNYAIAPHTDSPNKLVSLLFYLPRDGSLSDLGTSLYRPNDPSFRSAGSSHLRFEDFTRISTLPYVPNSLFAFVRSDTTFHGVEPITRPGVRRDLLLYNIYVRSVGRRAADAADA